MAVLFLKYIVGWSYEYLRKYVSYLGFILFLSLAMIVLNLYQINYIQSIIDAALQRQWIFVLHIILGFIFISLSRMLRNFLFEMISNRLEAKVCFDMKGRLVRKLFATRLQEIERVSMGQLLNRYNEDVEKVSKFMLTGFQTLLFNPLMSICGFLYLFRYSGKLSVGVFLPIPLFAVILNFYSKRAGSIYEEGCKIKSGYVGSVYDITHGTETIIANQMTDRMQKKLKGITESIYDNEVKYYKNGCSSLAFIMSTTYVPNIITFLYGGLLAMNGEIQISLLFAYGQLMSLINMPIIDLFSSLNEMREIEKSMRRLDDLLLLEEESSGTETKDIGTESVIKFHKVSYTYGMESKKVFDRISFEVRAGECVGIAGESGVGKTTLLNLLCGFYSPEEGSIFLWEREIGKWNMSVLRRRIAYVSQENQVMAGTVKENIAYGRPGADIKQIEAAAGLAGLDEFIRKLPDQYDTELGENMDEWSGGQYQRLNLARAFLQEADLYLFDEPTASLDGYNEKIIVDSIKRLQDLKKTVFIVSHRANLLKDCGYILFLHEGKIIEQGTHSELMDRRGKYYDLLGKEPQ
ncbi:MAG: ABC transporter ATP-binding protein/permease [Lachnospiraceae bacterium]|nr:ABC transporter ATP-binding protein/permease [Lachnospiraceae bacterium]